MGPMPITCFCIRLPMWLTSYFVQCPSYRPEISPPITKHFAAIHQYNEPRVFYHPFSNWVQQAKITQHGPHQYGFSYNRRSHRIFGIKFCVSVSILFTREDDTSIGWIWKEAQIDTTNHRPIEAQEKR